MNKITGKDIYKKIILDEIVDALITNLNPHNSHSVCYYDLETNEINGIALEDGAKLRKSVIEIARIDKDIDFDCICDECNDECCNYNWKENNDAPVREDMVWECIWHDTYDNISDLYHFDEDTLQKELDKYYTNKEQLKIKLAFQWGKFCEVREKNELSIDDDHDYVISIVKTFNTNWKKLSDSEISKINDLFRYDEKANIYDILYQYNYYDVDNLIANMHPILSEVGEILGRINNDNRE